MPLQKDGIPKRRVDAIVLSSLCESCIVFKNQRHNTALQGARSQRTTCPRGTYDPTDTCDTPTQKRRNAGQPNVQHPQHKEQYLVSVTTPLARIGTASLFRSSSAASKADSILADRASFPPASPTPPPAVLFLARSRSSCRCPGVKPRLKMEAHNRADISATSELRCPAAKA